MSRKMKDSGIEWIGEIPEGWKVSKLKYSAIIIMGQSPISENYNLDGHGIPFLQGDADFTDKYPVERVYTSEANKLADINDILLSVRAPVGSKNIANRKYAIGRGLCALRPQKINNHLLWYLIDIINQEFEIKSKGSTYDSITISDVKNVLIVTGTDVEQDLIANYLDQKCSKIDEIIEKQKQVIEKLKEYKQSVITEAVTKGLNPDVKMKDSGIEWIGEIPEHWEIRNIGKIAKVSSSRRVYEENYVDSGIPFYRSKEIVELSNKKEVLAEIFIPNKVFNECNDKSRAPKKGDLLLTSIGTIGKTWVSDGRTFYYKDGNITQIESNENNNTNYIEYCFKSNLIFEQYNRLSEGSTLLALTIKKIKKMILTYPPLNVQKEIVKFLDNKCSKIDIAILQKESLIEKLTEYKKSLIYECVTGKKEV